MDKFISGNVLKRIYFVYLQMNGACGGGRRDYVKLLPLKSRSGVGYLRFLRRETALALARRDGDKH